MRTREGIRRSGVAVAPHQTLREAAAIMDRAGVGVLAVVDGPELVGVVSDRDLVRRAMAVGMATDARVDAVMSTPVVTIEADADLHDAYALFRSHAVRRLAVVDRGRFIGILSIDDLLMDLAADLGDLARPVTAEVIFGQRDPAPVVVL